MVCYLIRFDSIRIQLVNMIMSSIRIQLVNMIMSSRLKSEINFLLFFSWVNARKISCYVFKQAHKLNPFDVLILAFCVLITSLNLLFSV